MAINRYQIDGYGQVELNNVAFRRDGRIEAQCALKAADFTAAAPAENGMILAVDGVNEEIALGDKEGVLPVALHYSTEHMYDERANGLKDFSLVPGTFLPRLGYLAVGDKFTTNCLCYDTTEMANDAAVVGALSDIATTPVYGTFSGAGAIKLTATAPTTGVALLVIERTTMPDGQLGVKFQVTRA